MYLSFPFVFKSAFSVGNPIFEENVSTTLQLLVADCKTIRDI